MLIGFRVLARGLSAVINFHNRFAICMVLPSPSPFQFWNFKLLSVVRDVWVFGDVILGACFSIGSVPIGNDL